MTDNTGLAAMFDKFARLHEKVFLYDYGRAYFLADAREVNEMPLARQQCVLNEAAARFLAKCDGTRQLGQYVEAFAQERGYDENKKAGLWAFVSEAVVRGHLVLADEAGSQPVRLFSNQGSMSGFPAHLSLELTYNCNLSCRHCYCAYYASTCHVDSQALLKKLDEFVQNGTAIVELTGGEPLLHPDFAEILEYCLKNFLIVAVISNGTRFDDKVIELLARHPNKAIVSISVDGHDASTHDAIRGVPGTFDQAVKAVRQLREHGIKVRLATVISKCNFPYAYDIARLGKELGVNWIGQSFVIPAGRGQDPKNLLTLDELEQVLVLCQKARADFPEYYLELEQKAVEDLQNGNCGAGWRTMTISPKGNIKLCVMADEDEVNLGNIFHSQLSELFARDIGRYLCALKSPGKEVCGGCEYLPFCQYCLVRPLARIAKMGDQCRWNQQNQYLQHLTVYRK